MSRSLRGQLKNSLSTFGPDEDELLLVLSLDGPQAEAGTRT